MTQSDLTAIRARADAVQETERALNERSEGTGVMCSFWPEMNDNNNAVRAFNIHARADVPALLDEVERLKALLTEVHEAHREWTHMPELMLSARFQTALDAIKQALAE